MLLFWTPRSLDNRAGIIQIINIELVTSHLLEPTLPWVERAIFNVVGKSLEFGNPMIEPAVPSEDEVTYEESSLCYPFSIRLFAPSPARLALMTVPS